MIAQTQTMELTDTDLDTILDQETDDSSGCEIVDPRCSREAVYRVKWGPDDRQDPENQCTCFRVSLCCMTCYDRAVSRLRGSAVMTCARCGECMIPTYVEKTRSTR